MNPTRLILLASFAAGALSGAAAVGGLAMRNAPPQPATLADGAPEQPAAVEPAPPVQVLRAATTEADPTGSPDLGAQDRRGPADPGGAAVRALQSRLSGLETRLRAVEQALARVDSTPRAEARSDDPERVEAPRTPEERRVAMVAAGADPALAEDIVLQEAQRSLAVLSLRDQASREGWFGTDRYREELRGINAGARSLREQIGDVVYDRYLYGTGEYNRMRIASVIPGSAAESVGLETGDLIEAYADERVFRFRDLREMTTEGVYGELVPVRVRRGEGVIETWVPRGPLGVNLDAARVAPLE